MEDIFLRHTLQTFLQDNHTCPKLAYTLLEALYCDCHEARCPEFTSRHGATTPQYRQLHQRQAQVGWSQLFQGRLVTDWSHLQEAFLEQHNAQLKLDRRYYTGDLWARKLISLLWTTIRAQWDERNADRHGRTTEESQSIRHNRLLGQVAEQYAQGPLMLADDRDILAEPILRKSKRSSAGLALWLERNRPIVKLSTKDATAAIARTHRRITEFFTPHGMLNPPPPPPHPPDELDSENLPAD
jgi:hypothetical protein